MGVHSITDAQSGELDSHVLSWLALPDDVVDPPCPPSTSSVLLADDAADASSSSSAVSSSTDEEATTIIQWLQQTPSRISQSYLYDKAGSRLYEEICKTHEYYLTCKEAHLICEHAKEIATTTSKSQQLCNAADDDDEIIDEVKNNYTIVTDEDKQQKLPQLQVIIELGSGDGHKNLPLLEQLTKCANHTIYIPIDISSEALDNNLIVKMMNIHPNNNCCLNEDGDDGGDDVDERSKDIHSNLPTAIKPSWMSTLEVKPLCGKFENCIPLAASMGNSRIFLFLGSSLGNYNDVEICNLFQLVSSYMTSTSTTGSDRFLVGVDTPHSTNKPSNVIQAAYNDARGVTAAFTLNVLRHINNIAYLDFNYKHGGWKHCAIYSQCERSVITHVVANGMQTIHTTTKDGGKSVVRTYNDGERIFVEQSRKFDIHDMKEYAKQTGLRLQRKWLSKDDYHLIVEYVPRSSSSPSMHAINNNNNSNNSDRLRDVLVDSAVLLSSLTPYTGNAVTSERIKQLLPVRTVKVRDVNIETVVSLAHVLITERTSLVIGIHAYRSGRLLLDCGVPYIIILGGTDMNEYLNERDKALLIQRVIDQSCAVVAFDNNLLMKLLHIMPHAKCKTFLIPQAVSVIPEPQLVNNTSETIRSELGVGVEDILILLPAGIRPVKDVLFAVNAIALWHKEDSRVQLRIVGPMLDEMYAEEVCIALGDENINNCCRYCGPLVQEELHAAMRSANIVINTSTSEGMCNSILEAMLIGTPVVARANGGNIALINDGVTGLLFDFDNPTMLVDQAKRLVTDSEFAQKIIYSAKKQIGAKHSIDVERLRYAEVVKFALENSGPPQRDRTFLGIHAPIKDSTVLADVYGTLEEKTWTANPDWLLRELRLAHEMLRTACPDEFENLARKPSLNPIAWTIGHVAFTFDMLIAQPLRLPTPGVIMYHTHDAVPLLRSNAWTVYDSMRVSSDERWELNDAHSLPNAVPYLAQVHEMCANLFTDVDGSRVPAAVSYLILYSIVHELWHTEDLIHTRNVHKLPPPTVGILPWPLPAPAPSPQRRDQNASMGDVEIPGGRYYLGADPNDSDTKLVLDCEKWEHAVYLKPFKIAACCVTNAEFAAFVDDGGYTNDSYWGFEGVRWLRKAQRHHPWLWRRSVDDSGCTTWMIQWFERELPLPSIAKWPVSHVNWYEAEAYCNWSGRRLPTEAEWEAACCGKPSIDGGLAARKARRLPWADQGSGTSVVVRPECSNSGMRRFELVDVDSLPEGDSAWGVRQMIGNVWEWTATAFYPYPGYVIDYPYREQSAPWFGLQKVARGGCFCTPDLILNLRGGEYRSFYHPTDRPELAIGFRTCAI